MLRIPSYLRRATQLVPPVGERLYAGKGVTFFVRQDIQVSCSRFFLQQVKFGQIYSTEASVTSGCFYDSLWMTLSKR